ncbi:hypothetical protein [Cyclobacterium salsum]|uniref:hypothetical protein n=1 Tax=Cyclobacterium salsum TaxID=2666329 RepID=UPI0013920EF0|nr:hypothetical protein [Cyclobacterium salsum]
MRGVVIFTLIFLLISSIGLLARQNACLVTKATPERQGLDLGEGGRLEGFRTQKRQFSILHYDTSGQKGWEIFLPLTSANAQIELLASARGEQVFVVEITPSLKGPGTALIHHIQEGKLLRSISFEDQQKLMGESLHAVFADEAYLYFLTADQDPDKFRLGKAPDLNFLLNRFRTSDFHFDQVAVSLPKIPESKWNPQWTFAGQVGNEKYMVLKDADLESNTLHCQVVSFDSNGQLIKNFALDYSPEDQAIRPSFHLEENDRLYVLAKDYNYFNYSSFGPGPSRMAYRIGAFFGFNLDKRSGAFYISGLSGEKSFGKNPFRFKAQKYNGFYVSKFDSTGQKLWETTHVADGRILTESDFHRRYSPVHKRSALEFAADSRKVKYSIRVGGNDFQFVLDQKGELMAMGKNGMMLTGQGTELTQVMPFHPYPEVADEGIFRTTATVSSRSENKQQEVGIKPVLAF